MQRKLTSEGNKPADGTFEEYGDRQEAVVRQSAFVEPAELYETSVGRLQFTLRSAQRLEC